MNLRIKSQWHSLFWGKSFILIEKIESASDSSPVQRSYIILQLWMALSDKGGTVFFFYFFFLLCHLNTFFLSLSLTSFAIFKMFHVPCHLYLLIFCCFYFLSVLWKFVRDWVSVAMNSIEISPSDSQMYN